MSDSLMAEVVIPFAGQRFDMELALFADVEVLIVECLRWVSEQTGLLPATGTHFFCTVQPAGLDVAKFLLFSSDSF